MRITDGARAMARKRAVFYASSLSRANARGARLTKTPAHRMMAANGVPMPEPACHRCRFFRVTWDEDLPYECRAFGFRSDRLPSLVVRDTSSRDCQLFEPREGAGSGT